MLAVIFAHRFRDTSIGLEGSLLEFDYIGERAFPAHSHARDSLDALARPFQHIFVIFHDATLSADQGRFFSRGPFSQRELAPLIYRA